MDPNTLNLDPDPEFWPNLDPDLELWLNLDPDPGLCYQFWKIQLKIISHKTLFPKTNLFENCKKKWHQNTFYSVQSLWLVNYFLNLTPFASILSYIYMPGSVLGIRILIHKAPEYGSNTDPDPQHWFGVWHSEPCCSSWFTVWRIRVVWRIRTGNSCFRCQTRQQLNHHFSFLFVKTFCKKRRG